MAKNNTRNRRSVFFCVPAPPGISPGQRFRFEHYLDFLKENDVQYRIGSFYSMKDWQVLYVNGKLLKKALIVLKGYLKRIIDLFRIIPYNYVYIYREVAPLGPPVFEWVIAKLLRKKIIYDFDDAIWIPATAEANKIVKGIKYFSKVATICKWSYKVSVGNAFLGDFARKSGGNAVLIPTVVDTENAHNRQKDQHEGRLTVGWTGTFSTLKYLEIVLPVIKELQEEIEFDFLVIADKDPKPDLRHYRFIKWNRETEVNDLMNMHFGLMPLYNSELEMGKCGFKAIQYMALGMPALVSPVGVNKDIVEDGINGFLCDSPEEWKQKIKELLRDERRRTEMGQNASRKIASGYSVQATQKLFLELFN